MKDDADRRPLTEHLGDLRSAILRVALTFVVCLTVFWFCTDWIFSALFDRAIHVLKLSSVEFVALSLLERFWIPMKLSIAAALSITMPVMLIEVFRFLKPALRRRELDAVRFAFALGPILFVGGAALWFYVALPQAVSFLITMGPAELKNMLSLSEFIGFGLSMGLVFGGLFEVPLILMALMHVGLISSATLARRRKAAILILATVSAVATPSPDAFSMLVVLIPLILLFELTLLIGRVFESKRVEVAQSGQSFPNAGV